MRCIPFTASGIGDLSRRMEDERTGTLEHCESCAEPTPPYQSVIVSEKSSSTLLCSRCWYGRVKELAGGGFDYPGFPPLTLTDRDGTPHRFELRTM